jgi:hypothetical protein
VVKDGQVNPQPQLFKFTQVPSTPGPSSPTRTPGISSLAGNSSLVDTAHVRFDHMLRLAAEMFFNRSAAAGAASLALSENEKPRKQKIFCERGQQLHDTGSLFTNFQGVLRSASWSTSPPIFFLSN